LTSAAALTGDTLTANGIETINLTVTDTNTTVQTDTLTLSADALKTLTITGNSGFTLTSANTTVTSVNASALTGAFTWTAGTGNLAAAAAITGSATAANTVTFTAAATAGVTYTGGAGNDVIIGQNGKANTVSLGNGANSYTHSGSAGIQNITGGTGADTITGGTSADVIVGGGGADVITGGAGADRITVSGNTATIVQASGASGANTSTTIQPSELTAAFDVIFGASTGLTLNLGNTNMHTGLITSAGTNLAAGVDDSVIFARGTYDAANGVFTYGAAGLDTAMTYDSAATAGVTAETVILVGFVAGTASTVSVGILTLG